MLRRFSSTTGDVFDVAVVGMTRLFPVQVVRACLCCARLGCISHNLCPYQHLTGAGLAGVSTSFFLACKHGLRVALIDRGHPLTATSSYSTECFRHFWTDHTMMSFMGRSISLMDKLAAISNNAPEMKRTGYVFATREGPGVRIA